MMLLEVLKAYTVIFRGRRRGRSLKKLKEKKLHKRKLEFWILWA